jgi:transposase-like protein
MSTAREIPGSAVHPAGPQKGRDTRAARHAAVSFPQYHGHVTCVDPVSAGKEVAMPAPHPIEFRQRAVELARKGDKPVAQLAKDLGVSESCLRNWMSQADTDDNGGAKLSSAEKKELAELRKKARQLELENEILKRAAAYFARENVLPK